RVVRVVDVGRRQRAGRTQRRVGLGERDARGADRGRIIGAVDGDGHRARRAVDTGDVKGFAVAVTGVQLVKGAVGSEAPVAVRGQAEAAVGAVNRGRGKRVVRDVARVRCRRVERTYRGVGLCKR